MKKLLLLITILLCGFDSIIAQENTGTIYGKVFDGTSDEPLIHLKVKIQELKDSIFITDMNGNYRIESLPEGFYQLKTSYVGYENDSISVYLERNSKLNINFNLKAKSGGCGIELPLKPSLVKPDQTTSIHVITREDMDHLPR